MPTYVYRFLDSDGTVEVQQSFKDDALTEAMNPATGKMHPVKKVFMPVGVSFKGGGFYKNDSRGASSGSSTAASTSSSSESTGSSGSSSSGSDSSGSTTPSSTPSAPATSSPSPSTPAAASSSSSGSKSSTS
jgi:predicted nucleic acid-binding Zn ribbon protein